MRNQGVDGRESELLQVGRGGDTALREPARRARVAGPVSPRRGVRTSGPRPVRPRATAAPVRPAVPACPSGRGVPGRSVGAVPARGLPPRRVLRPVQVLPSHILRRRRVAAMIGMALLTAAVVVLLGLLADVAAAARAGSGGSGAVTGSSLTEVVGGSGQVAGVVPR